ncbi:hypothetical protein F8388_021632 [Cannabis sativa]|uniref:Uncharacterized protein n=1 Tax=Cannabis sativa TaxID=3483 RepID=A0A7J6G6F3_CANSA|nr:hypothetical protein F8388_021632 [Cannabis sativa]
MGIAESAHDSVEKTLEAAVRLAEQLAKRKWNGEVYAEIRKNDQGLDPYGSLFDDEQKKIIEIKELLKHPRRSNANIV